jgi:hypothetical protein
MFGIVRWREARERAKVQDAEPGSAAERKRGVRVLARASIAAVLTAAVSSGGLSACAGSESHSAAPGAAAAALARPPFAVMSTRRTGDDQLPADVVSSLSESTQPAFAPAGMRAARRVEADQPVWLVEAADSELCIVRRLYPLMRTSSLAPVVAHSCASPAEASAGRLVVVQSLLTHGTHTTYARVAGLAPDGVASVRIARRRRPPAVIPVARNAYEAVVRDPVSVGFETARKAATQLRPVQLSAFDAGAGAPRVPDGGGS